MRKTAQRRHFVGESAIHPGARSGGAPLDPPGDPSDPRVAVAGGGYVRPAAVDCPRQHPRRGLLAVAGALCAENNGCGKQTDLRPMRTRIAGIAIALLVAAFAVARHAAAEDALLRSGAGPIATAALVAEAQEIVPGQPFDVALRLTL